jgi:hypothetical protein
MTAPVDSCFLLPDFFIDMAIYVDAIAVGG